MNMFGELNRILTGGLRHEWKKKLVESFIWSMVTYAFETWTLQKAGVRKL